MKSHIAKLSALAALSTACVDDNGNNTPQSPDMQSLKEDMPVSVDMPENKIDMEAPDMSQPIDIDMPEIDMTTPEDMRDFTTMSLNITCQTKEECLQAIESKKEEVAQAEEGAEFTYGFGLVAGLKNQDAMEKSFLVGNQWESKSDVFNSSATLLPLSRDISITTEGDCSAGVCKLKLDTEIPTELLEDLVLGVTLEFCNQSDSVPTLEGKELTSNSDFFSGEVDIDKKTFNLNNKAECLSISYSLISPGGRAIYTEGGYENNFAVNL